MEAKPKIKLTRSPLDSKLELTSQIFLVVLWVLTILVFYNLPKIIPTHFNVKGQVDGFGDKLTLLILPAIGTIIYIGLTLLNRYPHVFNYATKITEENAERQYTYATRMVRYLKVVILIVFSLIVLFVYLTSKGESNGPGAWFLPLVVAAFILPIIFTIRLSLKK